MTQQLWEGLYPAFIDAGYSPSLFWSLGIDEIVDLLEGYSRKIETEHKQKEAEYRERAILLWNQNMQLLNMLSAANNTEVELQSLSTYYPELFDSVNEEEQKRKNEIELHKARMEDFAYRHNQALKKKRGE